jgi:hypothetical protein
MRKTFDAQKKAAVKIAADALGKVSKATNSDPFKDIISGAALKKLQADLEGELEAMAQDGASAGLAQVAHLLSGGEDELDAMLDQANGQASKWAAEHAAKLVTEIQQTTRDGLNELVDTALKAGATNAELSEAIADYTGFDDVRCDLIATTETAFADVQGNLAGWKESGVVEGKKWIVAQDEVCDECEAMDDQSVPLDGSFDYDGDAVDGPPGHPRCRCDVVPEVMSQADIDAATEEE